MYQARRVVTRSVNLYPEEWTALDECAYQDRVSASEIVRRLIREHLDVQPAIAPADEKEAVAS